MSKSDCSETSSEGREGQVPGPPSGNELGVDTEREGERGRLVAEQVGDVGLRSAGGGRRRGLAVCRISRHVRVGLRSQTALKFQGP